MVRGIRVSRVNPRRSTRCTAQAAQPLEPTDQLTVEMSGGAAETDIVGLINYYTDLPGASARLHSWGDISGNMTTSSRSRLPSPARRPPGSGPTR